MGQTICSQSQSGRDDPCRFEEWAVLRRLAEPSTDNWVPVYFSGGAILCLLVTWILSFCIRYRDFTRSFVICQLLPYTVTYLTRFCMDLYYRLSASNTMYVYASSARGPLSQANKIAITSSGLNLPLGTAVFLLSNIFMAHSRKLFGCTATWSPYFICLCVSVAGGVIHVALQHDNYDTAAYSTFSAIYNFVVRGCILACLLLVLVILFALCCCSSPRRGQSTEPSVSNARSRMAWSIPFVFISLLPLTYGMTVTDLFYTISRLTSDSYGYDDRFWILYHTFILADALDPYFLTVSIVLFLPAYRSTLVGSQGYVPSGSKEINVIKAIPKTPPSTHSAPSPVQVPSAPPIARQNQPMGQYDANLVTLLTTPTAMHASPLPGSVQPCTCQSSAFLSTPSYQMVQSPVLVQQPMDVSTCAHHQGNLVRYASQPNLVQAATLQPAVSMPAVNVVHGPYYVQ